MVAVHALVPAADVWSLLPRLEQAGASALELNIFHIPADPAADRHATAMGTGEKLLLSHLDPGDRAPETQGDGGHDRVFGVELTLGPERPAHIRYPDPDRGWGQGEDLAQLLGEPSRRLMTTPHLETVPGQRAVEERLAATERPVDLLVNNAGFGTYGRFVDLDVDGEQREVAVNVVALLRLTHAALGPMLARDRGAVLNVSSVAGLQATPGNATYGASKAFVATFSEAIHEELKGTGVSLTCVLPGFTRTEFQERAGIEGREIPGPLWQTAEQCVTEALAATRAGKAWVVTGLLNKVAASAAGTVPRSLTRRIAARMASRL